MKKALLIPLFSLLVLSGCSCIQGNGEIVSETPAITDSFHSIDLRGEGNIFLSQVEADEDFEQRKVRIETDYNILQELDVQVKNETLIIKPKKGIGCLNPSESIDIYVNTEEVKNISVSGSGEIIGQTPIKAEYLDMNISGSGEIDVDVEVDTLTIDISGSGEANLKGVAQDHSFGVSGSGNLYGFDLETQHSSVTISGSGEAEIWTKESLDVNVSGSGDLRYKGNPELIEQTISGSGSVEKIATEEQPNTELAETGVPDSPTLEDLGLKLDYPEEFYLNEDGSRANNGELKRFSFVNKNNLELVEEKLRSDARSEIKPGESGFGLRISTPESIDEHIEEKQNGELPEYCTEETREENDPYCEEKDWNQLQGIYDMQKEILEEKIDAEEVIYLRITPTSLIDLARYDIKEFNGRSYLVYNWETPLAGEFNRSYVTFIDEMRIEFHLGWLSGGENDLNTYNKEADEMFEKIMLDRAEE